MNSLHDYFELARRRPRAIPEEIVDRYVGEIASEHPRTGAGRHGGVRHPRRAAIAALITGLAVIAVGVPAYLTYRTGQSGGESASTMGARYPAVSESCGCPLEDFSEYADLPANTVAPLNLNELNVLEPTDAELAKLGIQVHAGDGITLFLADVHGGDGYVHEFRTSADPFPELRRNRPDNITPLPITPRLVTDDLGRKRTFWYNYADVNRALADSIASVQKRYAHLADEGREREALDSMNAYPGFGGWFDELRRQAHRMLDFNSMIPILIRSNSEQTGASLPADQCRPGVIVWLDGTPEAERLLPGDWRERLHPISIWEGSAPEAQPAEDRDRSKSDDVREGRTTTSNSDQTTGSEQPTRNAAPTWGTSHGPRAKRLPEKSGDPGTGDVSLRQNPGAGEGPIAGGSLFPNPVGSVGTVEFSMLEARTVAVSLHRISGERIRILQENTRLGKGEHLIRLTFEEVPAGMYLLAIGTERGEVLVRRIVVR